MSQNIQNYGVIVGRLCRPVQYFEHSTGARTAVLTVACRRNFPQGPDHEYATDFIQVQMYIAPKTKGVTAWLDTGDKVGVSYSLRSSVSEKDGVKHYYQIVYAESIEILESRTVRENRRKERAEKEETEAPKKGKRSA